MLRNLKATILPMVAILLLTLLGFGCLVVDLSLGYLTQVKIKNAIDFSALAGISQLVNQSNVSNAKNTALQYLNDNLTMTLPSFSPLTPSNEDLSIQAGVYDINNMSFTADESNPNVNALMISYSYNSMTYLASIFMINNIQVSDSAVAIKQIAGRMAPGGGFPLAIESSQLSQARENNNIVDLVQSGTANSFFTAFMESTASASDINQIIDYFINQTNGVQPPSLTSGENFQINNGSLTTIYMNLNSSYFVGMTFVSPIVIVDQNFTNMVTVQGFIGFTINDIYMVQNDYHISATIIPGYIDNRWSGLIIGAGPGNISLQDQSLLATSFGLIQ